MKKNFIPSFNRTTTRSALSVLLLFLTMLVILFYFAQNYRSNLIDFRKRELKRQVELSLNTVEPILQAYRDGQLSQEEALDRVKIIIRRMTYTGETMDNYIFMSSYAGVMLVQPLEPSKQDTFQLDAQDSYGNFYIRDLITTAQSPEGEGFVSYFYPPPGAKNPGEKLSFVKGVPELGCYIGTGMFFEDIDQLFKEYLFGPLVIIIIGFTSIYILIIIYMRPLIKCFQLMITAFHKISLNPDAVPEVPVDSFHEDSDEREILFGFQEMLEKIETSRLELKNSEKRYKYLYEESLGVRIIIDADAKAVIAGTNKSFMTSLGFKSHDFNGRSLYDIFTSGQQSKIQLMLECANSGKYDEALDFDLCDSKGQNRTILISDMLVVPEDHSKVMITGVDITNRKNAERRAALQNEQLIQADKLASLGVLVTGVAHEINNPNQFILSNAGLIEDLWENLVPVLDDYCEENGDFLIKGSSYSRLKSTVPEYLNGLNEGARRISRIVNDLKSLSRDTSGAKWSDVDVNDLLRTSVSLCHNMLKTATDNFSLELGSGFPAVKGNSQQLEQVLINLIQNASQSLRNKNETIKISSSITDENLIQITIEDTGCGIKADDLKKIFDPFYTTKRETGGTGIGMSISKSIIDEHGGSLKYESIWGEGTKVILSLEGKNES